MERRPPAVIAGELTDAERVCEHAPTRRDPAGSLHMDRGISGARPCRRQTRAEKTDRVSVRRWPP
jgi:hypothetical protein